MDRKMKSVAVYGSFRESNKDMLDWFSYAYELMKRLSNNPIYVGIKAKDYGNKIQHLNRMMLDKIKKNLDEGLNFESIGLYSLPDTYKQAAFDYDIYFSRTANERIKFVQATVRKDLFDENLSVENEIDHLSKYIIKEDYLAFEMNSNEFPPKFIMSRGKDSKYNSLELIHDLKS